MLTLQLMCVLSLVCIVTPAELPYPVLTDGIAADEDLAWAGYITWLTGDTVVDESHYRCLDLARMVPDLPGYEHKIRAVTLPEWPQTSLNFHQVKLLEIRPMYCVHFLVLPYHKAVTTPCQPITANGGADGRIDSTWGVVEPKKRYQACSAGSLQGYSLIMALYRRRVNS